LLSRHNNYSVPQQQQQPSRENLFDGDVLRQIRVWSSSPGSQQPRLRFRTHATTNGAPDFAEKWTVCSTSYRGCLQSPSQLCSKRGGGLREYAIPMPVDAGIITRSQNKNRIDRKREVWTTSPAWLPLVIHVAPSTIRNLHKTTHFTRIPETTGGAPGAPLYL
jgi:hypothetical protein